MYTLAAVSILSFIGFLKETYEEFGLYLPDEDIVGGSYRNPIHITDSNFDKAQNVTMRYVTIFEFAEFPELKTNSEVTDIKIVTIDEMKEMDDRNEIAFNHFELVEEYKTIFDNLYKTKNGIY